MTVETEAFRRLSMATCEDAHLAISTLNSLPPHPALYKLLPFHPYVCFIHDMSYSSPSSSFRALFNAALEDYTNKTGMTLLDHPLAKQLDKCDSVESISTLLQVQAREFREFRGEDGKIMTPLRRVVHVLHTFSTSPVFGESVGLVCPKSLIFIPFI